MFAKKKRPAGSKTPKDKTTTSEAKKITVALGEDSTSIGYWIFRETDVYDNKKSEFIGWLVYSTFLSVMLLYFTKVLFESLVTDSIGIVKLMKKLDT